MKSLVWLASYPKSGNTWLRAFLANYLQNGSKPFPINKLHLIGMGDSSANTYQVIAGPSLDVSNPAQAVKYRFDVLKGFTKNGADINFVKTHCSNGSAFQVSLIPPELTRSAVYIMRNPLDMVLSYADHYGLSVDDAIYTIGHPDSTLPGDDKSVYQFLGNWSNHVTGWSKARKFPVLTLRYEDMLDDACTAFEKVVKHIGLPEDRERLEKAVRFSDFKILKKQEEQSNFIEKSDNNNNFFRAGTAGQWNDVLSNDQVDTLLKAHGRVMKQHGYEV